MKNRKLFKTHTLGLLLFVCLSNIVYAQSPAHYYVQLVTTKGKGVVKLYNETPLHRNNFVKLVNEGAYDSLLFHRVIRNFMVQGGDPSSKAAVKGQPLGRASIGERIHAEIQEQLIHKRGAIAAARDNNPEKASSGSQFYIVQGRSYTSAGLDSLEEFRLKKKLTQQQREIYQTVGGVPHLDGEYTVFGELVEGIDMVDSIAAVKTDRQDRPLEDQKMVLRLLNLGEALDVELGVDGAHRRRGLFKRLFGQKLTSYYTLDDR